MTETTKDRLDNIALAVVTIAVVGSAVVLMLITVAWIIADHPGIILAALLAMFVASVIWLSIREMARRFAW